MKPSVLRAFMRRHGNAGVLAVGAYLGLRYLWSRPRAAIVLAVCSVISASVVIHIGSTLPHPQRIVGAPVLPETPDMSDLNIQRASPSAPTVLPHGKPLFQRTTRLFCAEYSWNEDGCGFDAYRWISDSEIIYAEAHNRNYENQEFTAYLYRMNVRTGRKQHLKRLEGLLDGFQLRQMDLSPDGQWLLWHGDENHGKMKGIGVGEGNTLEVARLNGRNHRQWPQQITGNVFLGWTKDSRHWFDFRSTDRKRSVYEATVHDIYRPTDNRHFPITKGNLDIEDDFERQTICYIGKQVLCLERPDPQKNAHALRFSISSLPPHVRIIHRTQIAMPKNLPNPNIVAAVPSPDRKRIAFIVGYGYPMLYDDYTFPPYPPALPSVYRPSSVFPTLGDSARLRPYCLLVCRMDGSQMHEVGTWQEQVYPSTWLSVENLQWLPNGKQLSFFCNTVFYTVPAD